MVKGDWRNHISDELRDGEMYIYYGVYVFRVAICFTQGLL